VEDHNVKPWRRLAGRTLMISLPGPELDGPTAERVRAIAPAGVILFRRNLDSPAGAARLLAEVRTQLPHAPLFAIDQEGGRVSRLEPWVGPTPSAAALARAGHDAVRRFARASGEALRVLGFNLDFAPVVDLCEPAATNGIGDRSYGVDPEVAIAMAGAFLDALQSTGVAGCIKHFPGLGPTGVDSHFELPTAERSREELEQRDLLPYVRLGERAASVMVGHGHYPALDPTPHRPASLSPAIVDALLRQRLGYVGLVVSDDLEMGAVSPLDEAGAAAVQALAAGCDLLLYCADLDRADRALEALATRAAADPAFGRRVEQAAGAVDRLATLWPAPLADLSSWDRTRRELIEGAILS
jgi:beta-N-acetylhexosaminidase